MSYTGGNPQQDLADNEEDFAVGVEASATVFHRRVEVLPHISQGVCGTHAIGIWCYKSNIKAISVGVLSCTRKHVP